MGDLLSMGWNFALSIGLGLAAGILFDRWLGTRPWGMLAFLLLGIASGFVNLFRIVQRLDRRNDQRRGEDGPEGR
ncbi:MAG: AtpZ/AtpI family protein [Nitrospinota bacterium]